jgi:hypothetical protein
MNDHEHDYWRTPGGGLECACGASKGPAPDLEPERQARVDAFGIFDDDRPEL